MTNLNDIISTFSHEDQQRFIQYLERKNKRNDTKNVQLFKFLVKPELQSKDICYKLYKSHKKEAYHALRKRLYQSIIDFIANCNLEEENSTDIQIIKYLLASRTFLLHNQFKVAYKILDKAETIAKANYSFSILNEIYHTKIQYAYANPSVDIDTLISKYTSNQKKYYTENQLNIVYAKIRQTLNTITYKGKIVDFQTILNQTMQTHGVSFSESVSFKALYQLMTIISISAFITKDYVEIESFIIDTYDKLKNEDSNNKQLFYHIQVLYMIANALFRNKKFDNSMRYLEKMHDHMLINKNKYYNTFKPKYNLLLALNYNFFNQQDKAIQCLEPFVTLKHPDIEALLDIYLSLIMIYFQKEAYKKAYKLFSKFYHTDNWYTEKAGKEWVIKKNLVEILLHIELHNIDLVESRLLSFKRTHYNYLRQINQQRVITFLSFVEHYYKTPEIVNTNTFKNKVENAFEWIEAKREDIFVMSFYAWLKSKMDNSNLYTTTTSIALKKKKTLLSLCL